MPITEKHFSLCKHHSKAEINFSERTREKGFRLEHCRKANAIYWNKTQRRCDGWGEGAGLCGGDGTVPEEDCPIRQRGGGSNRAKSHVVKMPHTGTKRVSPSSRAEMSCSGRKVNRATMVPNSIFQRDLHIGCQRSHILVTSALQAA